MAAAYAEDNLQSPFNAFYERPATMALCGDVGGVAVLEAGCGAGPLTAWLVGQGAEVVAFDASQAMAALARERLGADERATFHVADLAAPLSFAGDGAFDLVVASLVLHYVEDWVAPLREFRRVLRPGGAVVFSTHHPSMDWQLHSPDDYFAVKQVTERWSKGGREFDVTFWRRPLTAIAAAIGEAGFVIERMVEPAPAPELRDRDPRAYDQLTHQPQFLLFRLTPSPSR